MNNFVYRITLSLGCLASLGLAQLAPPNPAGVAMGHIHLNTKDPDAQRKLWVDLLGAQQTTLGKYEVYKMPGVLIMFNKVDSTAGTKGSVVDHIGVRVKDLAAVMTKIEAAHITVVSRSATQAMLLAPDDIRLELTEDATMPQPLANHHIHFYANDVDAMKKWYVDTFGAIPGKRGKFEAADLPGVNLSFTPSTATLAPTKGRAVDHIGFEIHDLQVFTKKLEANGVKFEIPYREIPALKIALAFISDPWGTRIELTEGLDKL